MQVVGVENVVLNADNCKLNTHNIMMTIILALLTIITATVTTQTITCRIFSIASIEIFQVNALRTGDVDLRFYITTVQDG